MAGTRMQPRFEDGRFVPAYPQRIEGDTLSFFQQLDIMRTAARNPLATLSEKAFRDPVVQTTFMGAHLTQVADPAMIRHCFVDNRDNYRMSNLRQAMFKPVLREGLFTAEGDTWKHARKTLSPIFTPKNIARFAHGMKATIDREVPDFVHAGETVELSRITTSLTYLVLSDALFSGEISKARGEMLPLIADVLHTLGQPHILDLLGVPGFVPRLGKGEGTAAVKRLRELIREVAGIRLAQKADRKSLPQDFLTLMIGAESEDAPFALDEIEDQMVTFIGAGHETTAQALSWMFYLLSQDTEARARAEAEVDALDVEALPPVDWVDALPFTMACFREALRLYPPAAAILRQANLPDRFGDSDIPADGVVMVHLFALHRHQSLWKHPDAFVPERFLGASGKRIERFQYLPFGVGHRVCIGERFAMVEAGILIASLMRQFRFDHVGEHAPWPVIRLSLQSEMGIQMNISSRRH